MPRAVLRVRFEVQMGIPVQVPGYPVPGKDTANGTGIRTIIM